MRCVHEAQLHERNCFVTLTYDDKHLPEHGSLWKPDLQKFFKRLRKNVHSFRYYACGEYGETTQRAHYHACLFGIDFSDKIPLKKSGEHTLYISKTLNDIWGNGNTSIGDLNFETAAYTARYIMKKQTGGFAKKGGGYVRIDDNGEIHQLVQPYAAMSLRDAIAKQWHQRFHRDIYNNDKDFIVMRGQKLKPTAYYDKLYDKINPEHMAIIKAKRYQKTQGLTDDELHTRALIAHAKIRSKNQI